jgi:F-type H+-transporting ATPase subunit epsilon
MSMFNLLIITPESTLYQNDILAAIFPGTDGFFEILANHAAMITRIKKGIIIITDKNKQKQQVVIEEGFFEFYQNTGVLLSMRPAEEEKR